MSAALAQTARAGVPEPAMAECRALLAEGRKALREEFRSKPNATRILQKQCALVDGVLKRLWEPGPADWSLVAVGGFGRGDLYPYSDVDVLVLLPEEQKEDPSHRMETLVGALW
ncbi:MAG: nucleotidyltransferase domain-containing protein, partial [Burkholderiales bacterium]